jgi:hypothetical protein
MQCGFNAVLLIVREDNLPAAINACRVGKWNVYTGDATFHYIKKATKVDLKLWLNSLGSKFQVNR